ncbi:MAG TPA: glycerol-3-phosphate dehydrogenase/oxidase [Terriglobales bacterium]|nr:glycerol-3-phosphate dehydrogenase/oxidase [Terriglobales bacterium]
MKVEPKTRPSLEGERFHVIVIGGGINGVAIARECARGGKRTLLVEQHDFASGTTSRSTRIIHGGLRYLEHGEIGLVRESLRERQRLVREKPHLVRPMHFVLALDEKSRRSALSVRAGLWIYRRLGGRGLRPESAKDDQRKLERLLDSGRRWSIFSFEDAQCEFPERLIAEWLVEALEAGAVARNQSQVLAVDVRHKRAVGVLLRDRLSGKEERVEAGWVVNAAGPWVDRVCWQSQIRTEHEMIGGVRGSHIVLPRFDGMPEAAVYTEAVDGRPFFVIPWNEQVLVGTTEVPDRGDPAKTQPSADEIEYLLQSILKLFPRAGISSRDILYSFAGIRPLPFSSKTSLAAVSRKHYLHDHADDGAERMISVIGGKLTTAAELAGECAAKVGVRRKGVSESGAACKEGLDPLLDRWTREIAGIAGISEGAAEAIVEWHGSRAIEVARLAQSSAEMRASLCPHTQHIVAEAVNAFAGECAVTLGDVLLRRVPVALGRCWSHDCARQAAARIGAAMAWTEREISEELDAFEQERAAFLHKSG